MEKAPTRNWDWFTAVTLFLLMQVSAARLVTTNWAPNLYFTESLAATGTMLGLALGASRFTRRVVVWLSIAYTLVVVPWQISEAASNKLLLDRLGTAGSILLVSLGQFTRRQPVKDPLFFVAFASVVFWLLCLIAGFAAARRRNVLVGIIPSGIIILVIQIYANYQLHGSWWLGLYLLVALLLAGRAYYLQSERTWAERRVYVNDEAWTNILGRLFSTVALAILIAWLFPTSISSVQGASEAWRKMTQGIRDRLSNAVTSLKAPYGAIGSNYYGTSLLLGENAAQGDTEVFTVNVLKPPDSPSRYYWRGRVYDTYGNGGWTSTNSSNVDFEPVFANLNLPDIQGRSLAQFRFTIQFPTQSLIYSPSEPVWLDKPASVQVTPVQSGLDDVLSWQAKRAISQGSQYQVRAAMGNPNALQLREAGTAYPAWVRTRYLEVPNSIRGEFQALAERITADQATPYDKAAAITSYLRVNLQYVTSVPPAPDGRDPVEWVLFDYKKGFCNYYASAEVLMLRTVGVPARLAVGFAQGELVNGNYVVRRLDAHAWPEVFFPGLGWVEFEPTTSQLPLVRNAPNASSAGIPFARPATRSSDDLQTPPVKPATGATGPDVLFTQTPLGQFLGFTLLVLGAAALAYLAYRYRLVRFVPVALNRAFETTGLASPAWVENWLLWNSLQPVEQAFASVTWSLRWLGKPPAMDATAVQRAAALKALLPRAAPSIEAVASELETGLFTAGIPDVPRARRAALQVLAYCARARVNDFLGL